MSAEVIRQLTKAEENANMTSRQVLAWPQRVAVQKALAAVINSEM